MGTGGMKFPAFHTPENLAQAVRKAAGEFNDEDLPVVFVVSNMATKLHLALNPLMPYPDSDPLEIPWFLRRQ